MNYRYLFKDIFNDQVIADIGEDLIKSLRGLTPFELSVKKAFVTNKNIIGKYIQIVFNTINLVNANDMILSDYYKVERLKINKIKILDTGIEVMLKNKKGETNYRYLEYFNILNIKMVFDAYNNRKLYIKTIY